MTDLMTEYTRFVYHSWAGMLILFFSGGSGDFFVVCCWFVENEE
jgi:hypothetical protein